MAWNKDSAKAKAWREQRDAKIKALTEEFDRRTLALRDTREWRNLLNYFRTFHDYSYKNMSLIIQQCPKATWVAGFRAWKARGRQVRKGEHGLIITAPSGRYEVTDKEGNTVYDKNGEPVTRQGFKAITVFDISQTDPIPGADDLTARMNRVAQPLTGEAGSEIIRRVSNWLESVGWTIVYKDMPVHGDIDLEARVILLNASDAPDMQAVTLLHDAAHVAFLSIGDKHHVLYEANRGIAETENASVAFVLAGMMGLDTTRFTIGYAAGWAMLDRVSLRGIAEHVQKVVKLMADAILDANSNGVQVIETAPRQLGRAA